VKRQGAREWKNWLFENGSYKLVALFVTLILWVTILGRRDFPLVKEMEVKFLLPPATMIANEKESDRRVTVKVSGPRAMLAQFNRNPGTVTIDLRKSQPGLVEADITALNLRLPDRVRFLAVTPPTITVNILPAPSFREQKPESPSER
jgi:YbbR domain-containing protein